MKATGQIFVHGTFADRWKLNVGEIAEAIRDRLQGSPAIEFLDEAGERKPATVDPDSWRVLNVSDDGRVAIIAFDAEAADDGTQVSPLERVS